MTEPFKYALNNVSREQKYLLAMSGGVDSCVLFHLFIKGNIRFEVAHANFGLRGNASNLDEEFVTNLCSTYNIVCHSKKLNVAEFKETHNDSTQSAARKLRYTWFHELMIAYKLDFLVTAHHLDDSIETFFINLLRGTGLKGLTGIGEHNILRPLLKFQKKEIIAYAQSHDITWREDASNAKHDYVRNKIRHKLTPTLFEINPNIYHNFLKTFTHLKNDVSLINDLVEEKRKTLFKEKEDHIEIAISDLININTNLLFYLFEPFGFNNTNEIKKLLNGNESAEITSLTHRLIKNRAFLLISKVNLAPLKNYIIDNIGEVDTPIQLKLVLVKQKPNNTNSLFDFNKIKFPLSLRLAKNGDIFYPKGMNGKSKKVSKYFKDEKFSKIQKERTWLLTDCNDQIIWIIGHRQDERFLPTTNTTLWLEIKN